MSILCDFCGEVNSLKNKGMNFVIGTANSVDVAICERCIARAVDIVRDKNSEAPAALTDEASGLVRNEQGNEL
nr:hypothetical protein [Providencia rettgeri]